MVLRSELAEMWKAHKHRQAAQEATQELKHDHLYRNEKPDSLTIGTAAKGIGLKVYFNSANPTQARGLIAEAMKLKEDTEKRVRDIEAAKATAGITKIE